LQTLASFGVGGDLSAAGLPGLRDRLARAMGDARIDWLAVRPGYWLSGNLAVTHAGPDPARPIPHQDRTLQWGHPDCGRRARADGMWVAHGHVIVPEATLGLGIIRMDTGAYAGGPLSAVVLGDGAPRVEVSRA
jgi:serine/threonine protein phosphatase 1